MYIDLALAMSVWYIIQSHSPYYSGPEQHVMINDL